MRLVVGPLPIVHIAICVVEGPVAMSFVFFPLTDVTSPIWPLLLPLAITETTSPLSCVYSATLEGIGGPFLSWCIRIVFVVGKSFSCLHLGEVFRAARSGQLDYFQISPRLMASPPSLQLYNLVEFGLLFCAKTCLQAGLLLSCVGGRVRKVVWLL